MPLTNHKRIIATLKIDVNCDAVKKLQWQKQNWAPAFRNVVLSRIVIKVMPKFKLKLMTESGLKWCTFNLERQTNNKNNTNIRRKLTKKMF